MKRILKPWSMIHNEWRPTVRCMANSQQLLTLWLICERWPDSRYSSTNELFRRPMLSLWLDLENFWPHSYWQQNISSIHTKQNLVFSRVLFILLQPSLAPGLCWRNMTRVSAAVLKWKTSKAIVHWKRSQLTKSVLCSQLWRKGHRSTQRKKTKKLRLKRSNPIPVFNNLWLGGLRQKTPKHFDWWVINWEECSNKPARFNTAGNLSYRSHRSFILRALSMA